MRKMTLALSIVMLIAMLAGNAFADKYTAQTWSNGAGDRNWHTVGNWTSVAPAVPQGYCNALIGIAGANSPIISADASAYKTFVGNGTAGELTLNAGNLTGYYSGSPALQKSNYVCIGYDAAGVFNMNGGAVYTQNFALGYNTGVGGVANVSAGTINADIFIVGNSGSGILTIGNSAVVNASAYQLGKLAGSSGACDVYGALTVNGWYGGTGNTVLHMGGSIIKVGTVTSLPNLVPETGKTLNFDTTTYPGQYTIITCVPEPMSALLMLCGLPLLRRRRSA